jgi:hypothetical protein
MIMCCACECVKCLCKDPALKYTIRSAKYNKVLECVFYKYTRGRTKLMH